MKRGFTLIEMLVVIAIISVMTSIVFANTHRMSFFARTKASAGVVLDSAKQARSNSISVTQFQGNSFPSYGLSLNNGGTSIIMYALCVADNNLNASVNTGVPDKQINDKDNFAFLSASTNCGGASPNGLVKSIPLQPTTRIKRIVARYSVNGGPLLTYSPVKVDILFLRPEPTVWITTSTGGLMEVGEVDIVVGDTSNFFERTVTFQSNGQFYAH